jgi:hypothetical protein
MYCNKNTRFSKLIIGRDQVITIFKLSHKSPSHKIKRDKDFNNGSAGKGGGGRKKCCTPNKNICYMLCY